VATLVQVTRNGVVERVDDGHCVVCDASGSIVWSAGDPQHVTYLRSSAKPFQATALVLSGALERFHLGRHHLALACGSHHGEPDHVRTALDMLTAAGVPAAALQCGTHDLAEPEGSRLARAGLHPTPLHNNCSGKHAGMLAACSARSLPTESYLDVAHPVQQTILSTIGLCADLRPEAIHVGIDGCSAPNFAMPLARMARAFACLACPDRVGGEVGAALRRIGEAMRMHPWLVSGTTGFDTALMRRTQGVIAKAGAEGVQCVALPALGLGIAVKISSGRADRLPAVVLAIMRGLGVLDGQLHPDLVPFDAPPTRNHRGIRVGDTQLLVDTAPLAAVAERYSRNVA
jgi:L-asparaginase II